MQGATAGYGRGLWPRNRAPAGPLRGALLAVIAAFAAAHLGLFLCAAGVADTARLHAERYRLTSEIQHLIVSAAHNQAIVSSSDAAVIAVSKRSGTMLAESGLLGLWPEFGISAAVLAREGRSLATVVEGRASDPLTGAGLLARTRDLEEEAIRRFERQRMAEGKGFVYAGDPLHPERPVYAARLMLWGGVAGVAVAQVVLPDADVVLPSGPPAVLVTFTPVTEDRLASIAARLGMAHIAISAASEIDETKPWVSADLGGGLSVRWQAGSAMTPEAVFPLPWLALIVCPVGALILRVREIAVSLEVPAARHLSASEVAPDASPLIDDWETSRSTADSLEGSAAMEAHIADLKAAALALADLRPIEVAA